MNATREAKGARLLSWSDLGRSDGNALLIVNSPDDARDQVSHALGALSAITGGELHVVANPTWREFLSQRGVPPHHVMSTETSSGVVEINHFLETSDLLGWAHNCALRLVTGSAPHNPYNMEVKEIFEQRALLLLGNGDFLAHSLPGPYVYLFDAPSLVARFGRSRKVLDYLDKRDALLSELHALWKAEGRPAVSDSDDFGAVTDAIARHLGPEILNYDEQRPMPLCGAGGSPGDGAVADYVQHLRGVLHERDQLVAALLTELRRPLSQQVWLRLRHLLGLTN
jgi:hypothetical protein